jgi:hypothetical protein
MPLIMGPNTSGVAATTTAIAKETRWRHSAGGGVVVHYPEAASGDFKKGEIVILSSGKITQLATAPAALAVSAVLNTANVPIVGMALADATQVTVLTIDPGYDEVGSALFGPPTPQPYN